MAEYDIGQLHRETVTFLSDIDDPTSVVDPGTVTVVWLNTSGTATTVTYDGGTSAIKKQGTGVYYIDVSDSVSGTGVVTWTGSGGVSAETADPYVVRPSYTWDPLAVLTLDEAKRYANLGLGTDVDIDVAVLPYVTAVSRRLDEACGPIVKRNVTETHRIGNDGRGPVILNKYPVAAVTTVTEYHGTTATVLTGETHSATSSSDYLFDGGTGLLYRRSGGVDYFWPVGLATVVVTYSAGRYDNTASVDMVFKAAAGMMLANAWRREQGAGSTTFGVDTTGAAMVAGFSLPQSVKELLAGELRAPRVA